MTAEHPFFYDLKSKRALDKSRTLPMTRIRNGSLVVQLVHDEVPVYTIHVFLCFNCSMKCICGGIGGHIAYSCAEIMVTTIDSL